MVLKELRSVVRGVYMALKLHEQNGLELGLFLCIHYEQILIMALAEAQTTYGIIGVKVWICKGEYQHS